MDQGWGAGDYTHSSALLWQLHSEITQNRMTGMDQGWGAGDYTLISFVVTVTLWNHTKHNDRNGPRVGCWGLHTHQLCCDSYTLKSHKTEWQEWTKGGVLGITHSSALLWQLHSEITQNRMTGMDQGWGAGDYTLISFVVTVTLWNHTKHNDRNGPRVGCWGLHTHQPCCGSYTLKSHKTEWQEWTKGGVLGITHTHHPCCGSYTLKSHKTEWQEWTQGGVLGNTHCQCGLLIHRIFTERIMI